ncbi:MAG: nucleoside 2-deoxyribosyltransferase [candidate division WOR-3 bacterium]
MKIYLSGPIYIDNKELTETWRNEATKYFNSLGIDVINPCRNKATYTPGFHTPNEILFRDLKDIDESDIILAYLILAERKLPIGTVAEIMYAWLHQKPVVVVSEDRRILQHPWIQALSVKIFNDLSSATKYITSFWT